MAMGMTEDEHGVIWSVSYPASGVVSCNPKIRVFRDYGHVHAPNWPRDQRYVAADDAGWIYVAVGNTSSQIIAFDPARGLAKPMPAQSDRKTGSAYLYREMNGKVYGQSLRADGEMWHEFHGGGAAG
jgi:streptogramin lyase